MNNKKWPIWVMAAALAARGYQAVLKDWQDACIENNLLR